MAIEFCPQEVAWGDVATWAGFAATAFAAWGVFRIANRDRSERELSRKEAERARASSLLPEFNHATATISAMLEYQRVRAHGVDPKGEFAIQMRDGFMRLTISGISAHADLSALSAEITGSVRLAATAIHRDQAYLAALPSANEADLIALADAIPVRAQASRNAVLAAAEKLWEVVEGADKEPPWRGQV
ncbi:hypothetical protein GCM10011521_12060 [Arenimonas soli]|uniref:Uncharacterized protein n=1 Tax=Arenimonas soli TaxID=2269504 RepID=A0ABQ1HFJ7_9GAMM|nr:hypothetical protein GCM10011521_12060 [Arenimonas soli]